jgi:hypothetical protein
MIRIFPTLALLLLPQETPPRSPLADQEEGSPPRGLRVSEPGAFAGYTLFAPIRSGKTFLVDMDGKEVHVWESEHPPLAVYLREDGSLLRGTRIDTNPTFHGGGLGGRIQELAPDGSVTWEYVLSDEKYSQHHDFEPLPNGNLLVIAWELLSKEEAVFLGRDPAHVSEKGFWPDWVLEVAPTRPSGGRIVWEWHAKNHLIQDRDPALPNYGRIAEHPGRVDINGDVVREPELSEEERRKREEQDAEMRALGYAGGDEEDEQEPGPPGAPQDLPGDWTHINSVDYYPELDLILLSTPELCEIWIIDHSTTTEEARGSTGGRWKKGGDLLYRWGNPRVYGAGQEADKQLFYQHQPEWVPPGLPGAGNVTVFNNGKQRPGKEHSSVDELVLPFDPARGFLLEPGKPFGPARPVWSYSDPERFFSFFISGCQRLPNGNTFVCSGKQGRLFEVTPAGQIVWEYWNPHGGEIPMSMGRAAPPPPGPPPGAGAGPGGGPGGPGGGGPVEPTSCFRATRIAPDHPGLKALGLP